MSDYKATLNLPHTDFAMKANLAQREPEFLKRWTQANVYQLMRAARQGAEQYVLHDGPPYANGDIHIGHAVNKILKDMMIKSKSLSGYDTPYIPGWDCHGLPIELQVEKKHGKPGYKIDANTFRQKCRVYAQSQVDKQRESFKRLGVLADWDNPYLTMSFQYEADILHTLADIVEQGHLQKGFKPVHWCTDCGSSLAEAEVEYQDKQSNSIYVRFPVISKEQLQQAFGQPIDQADVIIWTTTPWTLPANMAVSAGPEIDYVLVDAGSQGKVIVAESLLESVMAVVEAEAVQVLAHCKGSALAPLTLQHPFNPREVPVILGEHVTTETGTGLVHTAPAHGVEDYQVCAEHGIEVYNPVGANGVFLDDTPLVAGQYYSKANPIIIEALKENGNLWYATQFEHSYPHCWRHKTPLIFRATPQWFISMEQKGLRNQALAEIQNVEWIPEWGQARIEKMIGGRPDWCISRQRTWGTPLPLFIHQQTGELHPKTVELIRQVADKVAEGGIEAWFEAEPAEFLGDEAAQYDVVRDTLDVWFDSGVSFAAVLQARGLPVPANMYLEGSDQHRGWFHTSLLASVAKSGCAPFSKVLTHGFVVDDKGRKMSKSLGNVILPQEVIKQYGADVLRLWTASADYRGEMSVSNDIIKRTVDIYRRVRNTSRFLLANLNGFDPAEHRVPMQEMLSLDQWAVARALEVQQAIQAAYDDCRFHAVVQQLHDFCALDMGSFYLDVIKDRQYTCQENSRARRSAQTAMYHIIQAVVRWMMPVLSFTADEIWAQIPGQQVEDWVFLSTWYDGLTALPADSHFTMAEWQQLMQIRDGVNKAIEDKRKAGELGSALEAEVTLYADNTHQALLQKLQNELRFVLITSDATVAALEANAGEATALEGIRLTVEKSSAEKCERCWHRRADIGSNTEHPTLCGRCVENVAGAGEERHYA